MEIEAFDQRAKLFTRDRTPKGGNTFRNIGAEHSRGHLLLFCDSDDLLANFSLETRVNNNFKNAPPDVDFLVSRGVCFFEGKAVTFKLISKPATRTTE